MIETDIYCSKILDNRRFDPIYYNLAFSAFQNFPFVALKSFCRDFQSGFGAGKDDQATEENGIIQIRPTNIDNEGMLKYDKNIFVPASLNKTFLEFDDVLFNNTNSQELVGKTAILKEDRNLFFSNHITRIKVDKTKAIPDYLWIILNIYQKRNIFYSICTNWNNQSGIGIELLKSLKVPLPPTEIQQKIVDLYNNAVREKQTKEQEAKILLDSIDGYLLKELGIELPENSANERYFKVNISELVSEQLDVKSTRFKTYKRKSIKYDEIFLSEIASITKGKSITKDKIMFGDYPVIAGGQTSPYSHSEYNEVENAITISASGAYSGYVWFHDYKIFASDCSVVRSKDETEYLTSYIYSILKVKQDEIYRMQKGAGQPHIYPSDIAAITIPVIDIQMQQEIVKHIQTIHAKAKQLQKEAGEVLEKAKRDAEKMIEVEK
jgi:restriction endonuclease S subunit